MNYYQRNRERLSDYLKKYRLKNATALRAKRRELRKQNIERERINSRNSYQRHKEKHRNRWKKWNVKNPGQRAELNQKSNRKSVVGLKGWYVRCAISSNSIIPPGAWPDSVVELKRAELKLKRILWRNQKT